VDNFSEIGKKTQIGTQHEISPKGIGLFFSEKEFDLFNDLGRELTEDFLQESFLLYRIDLERTEVDALYGESKVKRWLPEIEIFGRINVESVEPTTQTKYGITKKGMGMLTASVYIQHLEELNLIDRKSNSEIISGAKMGDFIFFKGEYYKIIDDGFSNIDNKHAWTGDRRFSITIKAIEIDEDIFKAR